MLLLNLAKIRTARERFDQVYPPATFPADGEGFAVSAPVTLGFDIDKDKDHFQLAGRLTTTLELACSRCLEAYPLPVDATFDLRYQPRSTQPAHPEREIEEDDFTTAYYDDDAIDLEQLVREQLYLAVPMKPLCADACRGLCPQCGTNLNREACACRVGWDDPRFAALKALRDNVRTDH